MEPARAKTTRAKVSSNGQVSIPAAVRRRWGGGEVLIIDKGDRLIVRPVLGLDELAGRYADRPGPTTDEMRREERAEDALADDRYRQR
ncbi:MAG: AbrB/MazE/SpoVT family DNA-binding domain-containing protein [Acidimicrobiales bacterium]